MPFLRIQNTIKDLFAIQHEMDSQLVNQQVASVQTSQGVIEVESVDTKVAPPTPESKTERKKMAAFEQASFHDINSYITSILLYPSVMILSFH